MGSDGLSEPPHGEEPPGVYRALFSSTSAAITRFDRDLTVIEANRRAGELFGAPPAELVGRPCVGLARLVDEDLEGRLRRAATEGQASVTERVTDLHAASYLRVTVVPVEGGGAFLVADDLSRERDATTALRREQERHEAVARLGLAALAGDLAASEVVAETLTAVTRLLPCDEASLLLARGDHLEVLASTLDERVGGRLGRDGSMAELAIEQRRLVRSSDVRVESDPWMSDPNFPAAWAAPILGAGDEPLVLVCLATTPWLDAGDGESFLQAIANVIGADRSRRAVDADLRASERRFRRVAEKVPEAVFELRLLPEARVEYVNPRHLELFDVDEAGLADDWRRVLPATAFLTDPDELTGRPPEEVVTTEPYLLERSDGAACWVETRLSPLTEGDRRVVGLFGTTRDITAQQETREALKRALVREQRATDELRRVGDLRTTMLAAVSHELRTPLTALLGFAELLDARGEDLPAGRRRSLQAGLVRNARRLEQLLSDLLDLDRLDRGVVEPYRDLTSLDLLVRRVLDNVDLRDRAVHLNLAAVELAVDAPKIERVVENLVTNAVKYGGGGQVWVCVEPADDGAVLVVGDDGPGVPDALKPTILDPFVRGIADGVQVPGSGIGLSLVARFVELHGGRVDVGDRAGGGAEFKVWLPAA